MNGKITNESEKLLPRKKSSQLCFLCICRKGRRRRRFIQKKYLLDATMYKGRYLISYKDWLKKQIIKTKVKINYI